jgi:hypothetical protein
MDPKNDSIGRVHSLRTVMPAHHSYHAVFQQIDVEESLDIVNGGTTLRMFGVTEVRPRAPCQLYIC